MRSSVLVLAVVSVLMLSFAGMASAFTRNCDHGTNGPNKMVGSMGQDALCGEGGNDKLFGKAGDDQLVGGSGEDVVEGDDGSDYIKGGSGKDFIKGGPGDDTIRGGSFNRTNDGAKDVIDCGAGIDTVYVTGADVVRGDCEERR